MSETVTISCDSCGKLKGAANKWLKLWVFCGQFSSQPRDLPFVQKDFCGEACFLEEINRIMQEWRKSNGVTSPSV
jgi:hypothetical protein